MKNKLAIVQFSGGKDSVAALHKFMTTSGDDYTIMLYYHDMGNSFPHILEFVAAVGERFKIPHIIGRSDNLWKDGYPSDIVPIWSEGKWLSLVGRKTKFSMKLQSSFDCCNSSLWLPMHHNMQMILPEIIVRGAKNDDNHTGRGPVEKDNGILYVNPLWDMTDEDVFKYIEKHDLPLPLQYEYGCNNSLDCMLCTGWVDTANEHQRIDFTEKHYPKEFDTLQCRFRGISVEIKQKTELYLGSL